jgi:hypothetical protein
MARQGKDEDEVVVRSLHRIAVGAERALLFAPRIAVAGIVSSGAAELAQHCRTFATREEHAARFCARKGLRTADERRAVLDALEDLSKAGLLLSRQEALAASRRAAKDETPAISALGIPTRDRPDMLARCLGSLGAPAGDEAPEIVVADGAEDVESRNRTRRALATWSATSGHRVAYAGREEVTAYARALAAAAGVDEGLVAFALGGEAGGGANTGGNRNALLLDQPGRLFVMADDDTLPGVRTTAPDGWDRLLLQSGEVPTDARYFRSWSDAERAVTTENADFRSMHARMLGRSLAGCAADFEASQIELGDGCRDLVEALVENRGRVRATVTGLFGDNGTRSPSGLLFQRGGARAELAGSEALYLAAIERRFTFRCAPCLTVTDGTYCQSAQLGLDQRQALPPFLPHFRSQGAVFGATLRASDPSAAFSHLPCAVVHRPLPERTHVRADLWKSAGRLGVGGLVLRMVTHAAESLAPGDPGSRLAGLGARLVEIATMPARDLEERVRVIVWSCIGEQLLQAEELLDRYDRAPEYWSHDLTRHVEALRAALQADATLVPLDLEGMEPDVALQHFTGFLRRMGELLGVWPTLAAAAEKLRTEGVRVAAAC